jgi:hypothetical protein
MRHTKSSNVPLQFHSEQGDVLLPQLYNFPVQYANWDAKENQMGSESNWDTVASGLC